MQTGLYDALAGRSTGASVSLITRSGTDHFHGSIFEFLRNDALNANLYFFNFRPGPSSNYNSLQASVQQSMSHGLQFSRASG